MSYIDLINSFWDSATTNPLSTGQVSLYFALLHVCNRSNWIEWFAAPNQVLSVLTGMSRSGILKARNELKQRGLIDFRERGTKATTYRLISQTISNSKQVSVQNGVQNGTQNGVQNSTQKSNTLKEKDKEKKSMSNDIPEKAPSEPKYPDGSFEMRCVERLITALRSQLPGARVPETAAGREKWADEIERMKRLDKRTEAEIEEALSYAVTDAFWKTNIRSTAKLREKFETLIMQSQQKGARGQHAGKNQGRSRAPNQFHNLEEHGYDYEKMVWGIVRDEGKEGQHAAGENGRNHPAKAD